MDALLTLDDVARTLNAELEIVAGLITRGELAALEISPGQYRVPPGDLRRFITVRKRDFRPAGMAEPA